MRFSRKFVFSPTFSLASARIRNGTSTLPRRRGRVTWQSEPSSQLWRPTDFSLISLKRLRGKRLVCRRKSAKFHSRPLSICLSSAKETLSLMLSLSLTLRK